jgi:hypothetical protein
MIQSDTAYRPNRGEFVPRIYGFIPQRQGDGALGLLGVGF